MNRTAATAWMLKAEDGRYLQVTIDFSENKASVWLDAGRGCSPCFDSAEKAATFAERNARNFSVVPTLEAI